MNFLVFQHVPHEKPGLITGFAKENNIHLEIIELWKPYRIPSISNYDALIIMGGPMSVYDDKDAFPSKADELKVINKGLGKVPMIGFCLGSQLLASALGANVYPISKNGKKIKEVGYFDIKLTPDGLENPLFKGFNSPVNVFQWHGDTFDMPKNSKLLATSSLFHNQAFSYKNAYGLQFHFEFTPDMVKNQIKIDRKWIHEDNEVDEEELLKQAYLKEKNMKKQSDIMMRNFLQIIKTTK